MGFGVGLAVLRDTRRLTRSFILQCNTTPLEEKIHKERRNGALSRGDSSYAWCHIHRSVFNETGLAKSNSNDLDNAPLVTPPGSSRLTFSKLRMFSEQIFPQITTGLCGLGPLIMYKNEATSQPCCVVSSHTTLSRLAEPSTRETVNYNATTMSDKPVLLFVTGAWHPPKCYDGLKSALIDLGYECVIPKMPTIGADSHGVTWEADKAKIIETSEPYFAEGREVVLIAHSYGGIPATAATEGQGISDRAEKGLKGGFHSIIFMAAFAIPVKGWDLITTFGGAYPEWLETGEKYTKVRKEKLRPSYK